MGIFLEKLNVDILWRPVSSMINFRWTTMKAPPIA